MARSGIYLPSGNQELTSLSPRRGSFSPGAYFQYQNWDFNAAGAAFELLTGKTMCKGSPQAGQLFRDCAAEFGVRLEDPSAALGSESAASAALRTAAFVEIRVVADRVLLSDADLSCAWESNLRSAAHADIRSPTRLEALRTRFEQALAERRQSVPSFAAADVLYAYGRKPAGGDA